MSQQLECNIRIYGDTTYCETCGKQWDTNDPEPPECEPTVQPLKYDLTKWVKDNSIVPGPRSILTGNTYIDSAVVATKLNEMQNRIIELEKQNEKLETDLYT